MLFELFLLSFLVLFLLILLFLLFVLVQQSFKNFKLFNLGPSLTVFHVIIHRVFVGMTERLRFLVAAQEEWALFVTSPMAVDLTSPALHHFDLFT